MMKLSKSPRAGGRRRLVRGVTTSAVVAAVAVGGGSVAVANAAQPASLTGIILGVGANETQRVVTWYASADTRHVVQLAPANQLKHGTFPKHSVTFPATVAANTVNGGFNGHATLNGLRQNTKY